MTTETYESVSRILAPTGGFRSWSSRLDLMEYLEQEVMVMVVVVHSCDASICFSRRCFLVEVAILKVEACLQNHIELACVCSREVRLKAILKSRG